MTGRKKFTKLSGVCLTAVYSVVDSMKEFKVLIQNYFQPQMQRDIIDKSFHIFKLAVVVVVIAFLSTLSKGTPFKKLVYISIKQGKCNVQGLINMLSRYKPILNLNCRDS